jgi:hypothetical protein
MSEIKITIKRDPVDANANCCSGNMTVAVDDQMGSLEAGTVEPKRGKYDMNKEAGMKDYPIPAGTYDADIKSGSSKNPNVPGHAHEVVEVKNVEGFADVLIHVGNTSKDTEGCILIGTRNDKLPCMVSSSNDKNKQLLDLIEKVKDTNKANGEQTTITIVIQDPDSLAS